MPHRLEMLQRQTQKMIMSPQMQQAIHMLQIPLLELQAIVQQELDTNPILEEKQIKEPETDTPTPEPEADSSDHESELQFDKEFENLKHLDDEWKDYFKQSGSFRKYTQQDEEKRKFMFDSLTTTESLHDHLLWQLRFINIDSSEKELAELIIGNIDDNGYLKTSTEEIAKTTKHEIEIVEEMIGLIQTFNPVGVCARNLKECLMIQLERIGKEDPIIIDIIENYLDLIAQNKYPQIAQALNTDETTIRLKAEFIATLDPKPGLMFSTEKAHYITPDVFVEKIDQDYVVTLNDEKIPHLYISRLYRTLLSKKETPKETKEYIKGKIMAGNWLIKNIHQRQQTISKIASAIVSVQHEFLDEGPALIKPLTMQQIADGIELHESTVSRAIANKYMQTPQGTLQFKYFFSGGVKTDSGEAISVTNVKQQIGSMIKDENQEHPLSDQDIINALSSQGIKIARRTISKYRKELGIPSSTMRKRT